MAEPILTVQVVGWNSAGELPATCTALAQLPADQVIIRYIDNASADDSVSIVRELLPRADVLQLTENAGFTGAHNIGLSRCITPYVLTHDPDLEVDWPGLQRLLEVMEKSPELGAVQGKLVRQERGPAGEHVIDSCGIVLTAAFNGRERGAGDIDAGQFDTGAAVDAVTGACGLYRMEALREVAHGPEEFFDADFFAYKEDVDLGWRLTRAGWGVQYVPVFIGTHRRTLGRRGVFNWGVNPRVVYQRLRSLRTRYSFRNWLWMIVKNAYGKQLLLHAPFIGGRKMVFLGFTLLYPPLLAVWIEIARGIPRMRRKRWLPRIDVPKV